jgi:hypothetical protein
VIAEITMAAVLAYGLERRSQREARSVAEPAPIESAAISRPRAEYATHRSPTGEKDLRP